MCTLSYFPLGSGFIATANRDENPSRHAPTLQPYSNGAQRFLIAREPVHGGANLAVSSNGQLTALLNGAFEPHNPALYDGRSRGLVLLDALAYTTLDQFQHHNTHEIVEPYTMVRVHHHSLEELRWDGTRFFHIFLDSRQSHIWASAQLYSKEVIASRNRWFHELLQKYSAPNELNLEHFHLHAGDGDPANDMVMNRHGMVRTVSVSQLVYRGESLALTHRDLLGDTLYRYERKDWETFT